jgi:hypothetical protein
MRRDFIRTVQRKVAMSALPASALRGAGHAGLTAAARDRLATLDLEPFAVSRPARFDARLDFATDLLRRAAPQGAGSWGRQNIGDGSRIESPPDARGRAFELRRAHSGTSFPACGSEVRSEPMKLNSAPRRRRR